MAIVLTVNISMVREQERGPLNIKMGIFILAIDLMIKRMVKGNLNGIMVIAIQGNISKEREQDMG